MAKPWSKLQKEFYLLRAEGLDLQLHCRVYRMNSQRGNSNCPRYWITLGKEIIWDYPKDLADKTDPNRTDLSWYPHGTDIPDISNLIREYIDTPKSEIMAKLFENDHWSLTDILRAADRRIGAKRLAELNVKTASSAARQVIEVRLLGKIDRNKMLGKMINTNPLHYKYYWWVVLKSDLPEDYPILSESLMLKRHHLAVEGWFKKYSTKRKSERMCTYDAMAYMKELENNDKPYFSFDKQLPRKGTGSPFDPTKTKWKDCEEWAPPFEDDTDPVWNGHK